MKKLLVLTLTLFILTCSLWAGVDTILSLKGYYTGNNIPSSGLAYNKSTERYEWATATDVDTWNNLDNGWWMKRQDYWMQAYDKTSFLDFGFDASYKNLHMVFRLDIMQDVLKNLQGPSSLSTNIPFVGALLDLSFPRVGFIEYKTEDELLYVSLGRRLLKWGPGSYDMALSDSQPYLDGLYTEFNIPFSATWNFSYNYNVITPKMWMNYNSNTVNHDVQKTFFMHKISFNNDYFRLSLAEINNVYGKVPNLLDASPFIIWHNSNQDDHSNVFLHLTMEGKVGPVRGFIGFDMDDFDLPHEGHSKKPSAMGFSTGIEWHVFDGEPNGKAKFDYRDYTIKEASLKTENGLNIGAEWYYLTPLMYNRNKDFNGAGKFTIPFQFVSLIGSGYVYYEDAYYLGFKYGPNSQLVKLYAEYNARPFEAKLSLEYLLRGRYGIESTYGDRDKLDDMGLDNLFAIFGDKTQTLLIDTAFTYYLQDAFKINANFSWQQDITHNKGTYCLKIGLSLNPLEVDWKHLF